jgi:hypothetical protein
MQPKTDPSVKVAQEAERARAVAERTSATQDLAQGLTADFRRAYSSPFSLFAVKK